MNAINSFTSDVITDTIQQENYVLKGTSQSEDDITTHDIDIKDIISRINKLNTKEKTHILNILRMTQIDYTKNTNGYFFNLLEIDPDILIKICNCLDLIEKNSGILKEMDRRRNELLNYYKNLIEERLQKNIQRRKDEYINRLQLKDSPLNIVIKRKNRINKKRLFEHITDPDLLIKEYNKSRNRFEKGSVYHRIIKSIKIIKSNRVREKKTSETEEQNEVNTLDDNDSGYDVKDNDSVVDVTQDSFHMSDNEDQEKDEDEKDDEKDNEEDDEDKYISENDIEDEYCEEDEDNDQDKITTDNTETEFRRFKNLLYKQGFEFNDNKNCMLVYQTYIT